MTIEYRPLSPTIGAELKINLAEPLDAATYKSLSDIWLDRKVILVRGQQLEDEDVLRVTHGFGEHEIHVRAEFHSKKHPEIIMISNEKDQGKPIGVLGDAEAPWHVDQIYQQRPTFGTMVYCLRTPPEGQGGMTYFCNLTAAYDRLPASLLKKIEGRRAIHSVEYFTRMNNMAMTEEQLRRMPDVSHPIIRTHPVLGTKSLFFSPGHTSLIEGFSEKESQQLLKEIEGIALAPDLVMGHSWRVGDVVMWDNTSSMHRREPFDGSKYIRSMKRVSFMHAPESRVPF